MVLILSTLRYKLVGTKPCPRVKLRSSSAIALRVSLIGKVATLILYGYMHIHMQRVIAVHSTDRLCCLDFCCHSIYGCCGYYHCDHDLHCRDHTHCQGFLSSVPAVASSSTTTTAASSFDYVNQGNNQWSFCYSINGSLMLRGVFATSTTTQSVVLGRHLRGPRLLLAVLPVQLVDNFIVLLQIDSNTCLLGGCSIHRDLLP